MACGIAIGDIHLGFSYRGIDYQERIIDRLAEIRGNAEEIKKNLGYAVLLGDLFHKGIGISQTITMMLEARAVLLSFSQLGIPIFIIQGNHDAKIGRAFAIMMGFKARRNPHL